MRSSLVPDPSLLRCTLTQGEYAQFETEEDKRSKPWVKEFNKFDLYTKSNERPDVKALWPHYQRLIDKFCPGKLQW